MADKASNVVLNFKMDGQVQYANTIRDINAIMNAAASEYKTHIAAMGKDAEATQKLAVEKKKLEIQMEAAKERTKMLSNEYEAMAKNTKTTTGQLANKYKELMNSERAEISLSNALNRVNDGLSNQAQESRKAQEALDKLDKESSELKNQTEKLNAEYKLQEAQLGNNVKESEKLALQTEHLNRQHELASEQVKNHEKQLEMARQQYGENSTEIDKYETELIEAKTAEQQLANQIAETNSKLNEQSEVLQRTADNLKNVGDKMKDVGKDLTLKVTAPILAMGAVATKTAIDYESAFAGVRKTVDATEKEFAEFSDGIREMSKNLPASASSIAAVAESAGQLGIQNKHLLSFTQTMIDLGEATNLTSEQAATEFARFANIVGMSQEDFDKLGSVVVDLGNNLATTEAEIVSMAMRLAGAGAQVGLTEAEIMAFSGALSSVGIAADAGGSAFSKVMVNMQLAAELGGKDLKAFAKVAGMSANEFKKSFEEDAAGAMISFIKGLSTAEERGMSAIAVLDEMGIKEVRMRDALLRAAGASDVFTASIAMGSRAWEENTALSEEAAQRYETSASKFAMFKNTLSDIVIDIGNIIVPVLLDLLETVKPWIKRFSEMDESTKKTIVVIAGLVAAIGPVLMIAGTLISSIGSIVGAFSTVSGAIAVVTTGVAAATPAVGALATVFTVLTGPVGLIIAGLAAITVGTIALVKHLKKDAIPEIDRFGEGVSDATKEAVNAFLDLNDEATVALKELSWSGKAITKDMADSLTSTFSDMGRQITSKLEDDQAEQLAAMSEFYANSKLFGEENRDETLKAINDKYEQQKDFIKNGEEIISEILARAAEENRNLTDSEYGQINRIKEGWINNGIKVLSQNELESKAILERMKIESGNLTTQQAAEVIRNSLAQRDGAVEAAEEQYDKSVQAIIKQRDEMGTISNEMANAMLLDAKMQRDGVVREAEEMHQNVISEAKKQAEEHIDHVNWETGEILSKWEVFKNKHSDTWDRISETYSKTLDAILKFVKPELEKFKEFWDENGQQIMDLVELYFGTIWEYIKMHMGLIKGIFEMVWPIITFLVNNAWETMKLIIRNAMDLILGIINTVMALIRGDWEGAWNAVKDTVMNIWDNIKKFFEGVDLWQTGKDIIQGLINGIGSMVKAVGNTIKGITDRIKNVFKKEMDTASPSKVMHKGGQDVGQGVADGINSKTPVVGKAMENVTNAIKKVTDEHGKEMRAIAAKQAEEEKAIQHKKNRDIENIFAIANSKKRKLTIQETQRIKKIEEQASQQLIKVQERYAKERDKIDSASIKKLESVNKEIESVNKSHLDRINKIIDEQVKSEQKLNDEFNNIYGKRVDDIRNSVGLFDEFASRFEGNGHTLLANLRSQVVGLQEWRETLQSLWGKIDDKALMEELEAMGPKAADQLKALNSLSEAELAEYVSLYNQKFAEAREQANWELAGMKEDTEDKINELRKAANKKLIEVQNDWATSIRKITQSTSDEFKSLDSVGKQAGQNLLDGLSSMEGALVSKAQSIAAAVSAAMASALSVNAPSANTMTFDTKWNAKGGIFTQPTIFGASGGRLQGAGEAGPEAVLPLNAETLGAIGKGIAKTMGGAQITINSRDDAESIARAVDRGYRRMAFKMG